MKLWVKKSYDPNDNYDDIEAPFTDLFRVIMMA
jgi:hypothetical protein